MSTSDTWRERWPAGYLTPRAVVLIELFERELHAHQFRMVVDLADEIDEASTGSDVEHYDRLFRRLLAHVPELLDDLWRDHADNGRPDCETCAAHPIIQTGRTSN